MRAMREAKYARQQAGGSAASARAATTRRAPVAPPVEGTKATGSRAAAADASVEELCGHRNMGGKTCTREAGHAAKNHRYS